jgi:flagellar biogenesis protein FliO
MKLALKISIGLLALASTSFGADTIAAPAAPSVVFSVLRMIGGLCLVFSLLFGGLWVYRNSARFAAGRRSSAKLKVIESRALGHRHFIFVVGYEQQRILLSTSPTGVTMLTHLPEATAEEMADTSPAPLPNFSSALMQALTVGRK